MESHLASPSFARTRRLYAVALWLACTLYTAAAGAAGTTGTVIDAATNQPVADVVVTATSPNLQGEQMVVTDSAGLYRIPSLPPGTYAVRLEKEAYKPYSRTGIQLRADTTLRIDAQIFSEKSGITENVTVVARPPSVDIGSS